MYPVPMVDMYEDVRGNLKYNKLVIGDLLFAEYTCPIAEKFVGIWSHTDYLVHVVSGLKTWSTTDGVWKAESGQTLFFKKGAAIIEQSFFEDFCVLLFFIPDNLIRENVVELSGELPRDTAPEEAHKSAIRVHNDTVLQTYFNSMMAYFSSSEKPSEPLLRLKLQELVVGVLTSTSNPALSSYFQALARHDRPQLDKIMEANFHYNLTQKAFAELCHRSLSAFKRDFRRYYDESPGRWLHNRRLDHAAGLLSRTDQSVSQIVFACGFEDLSHFSKAFKNHFGLSPSAFRKRAAAAGPVDQ